MSKLAEVLNGVSLLWGVVIAVATFGGTMYSDVQVLKADNQRMQNVLIDQASIKADVRVLDTTVQELRQNVIYLNTNLKEATDRMTEILIKLEQRVDTPTFKK